MSEKNYCRFCGNESDRFVGINQFGIKLYQHEECDKREKKVNRVIWLTGLSLIIICLILGPLCGCNNHNPRGYDVEVFRCRITRVVPWQIGRWPTIEEELCPRFFLPEKGKKNVPCPKTRKFYDGTGLPAPEWMRE